MYSSLHLLSFTHFSFAGDLTFVFTLDSPTAEELSCACGSVETTHRPHRLSLWSFIHDY